MFFGSDFLREFPYLSSIGEDLSNFCFFFIKSSVMILVGNFPYSLLLFPLFNMSCWYFEFALQGKWTNLEGMIIFLRIKEIPFLLQGFHPSLFFLAIIDIHWLIKNWPFSLLIKFN